MKNYAVYPTNSNSDYFVLIQQKPSEDIESVVDRITLAIYNFYINNKEDIVFQKLDKLDDIIIQNKDPDETMTITISNIVDNLKNYLIIDGVKEFYEVEEDFYPLLNASIKDLVYDTVA